MSYYQNQKKQRLQNILNGIEEDEPVKQEKLVAEMEIQLGLSQDKAEDYIHTLKNAEKVQLNDDGKLVTTEGGEE